VACRLHFKGLSGILNHSSKEIIFLSKKMKKVLKQLHLCITKQQYLKKLKNQLSKKQKLIPNKNVLIQLELHKNY